eukprot:TRINITY_DN17490_c0_g7_i1.p1 TRINITY_DN17490_c0_g7~~TRINITY_DN17490_c0_g7_i1.p1  ORF type:complete len:1136 (-),score=179.66 TRINITY_DN17490_c0_g7_i1:248-3655(-)
MSSQKELAGLAESGSTRKSQKRGKKQGGAASAKAGDGTAAVQSEDVSSLARAVTEPKASKISGDAGEDVASVAKATTEPNAQPVGFTLGADMSAQSDDLLTGAGDAQSGDITQRQSSPAADDAQSGDITRRQSSTTADDAQSGDVTRRQSSTPEIVMGYSRSSMKANTSEPKSLPHQVSFGKGTSNGPPQRSYSFIPDVNSSPTLRRPVQLVTNLRRYTVVVAGKLRHELEVVASCNDAKKAGAGFFLYFQIVKALIRIMVFLTLLSVPYLVFNLWGDGLLTRSYSSEPHLIAFSSVANMGILSATNSTKGSPRTVFDMTLPNAAFLVSALDALGVLILYAVMTWFDDTFIPRVRAKEMKCHTQAFAVYVDKLPRRLPFASQGEYAKYLGMHFDALLRAEVGTPACKKVSKGVQVVRRDDEGDHMIHESSVSETVRTSVMPIRSRSGRLKDAKGRRLGVLAEKYRPQDGGPVAVLWDKVPPAVNEHPSDLHDALLLHSMEFFSGHPKDFEDECLVQDVTLVLDWNCQLDHLRNKAREEEEEEPRKACCTGLLRKLDDVGVRKAMLEKELNEERDVLGAFVTFKYARHRDFIHEEYRFSRTILRVIQRSELRFGGIRIRVKDAGEPSDLYWGNLDVPLLQRVLRGILMLIACLFLLAACLAFTSQAKNEIAQAAPMSVKECQTPGSAAFNSTDCICLTAGYSNIYNDEPPGTYDLCINWISEKATATLYQVLVTVAVVASNNVISWSVVSVADMAKARSVTHRDLSIMGMTFYLQMLNLVIIAGLMNWDSGVQLLQVSGLIGAGKFKRPSPECIIDVGWPIMLSLTVNAFTVALLPLATLFVQLCAKRCRSERCLKLFIPPAHYFAVRHAQMLSNVVACVLLASAYPIAWPVLLGSLTLAYMADSAFFLYGVADLPTYRHHLAYYFCSIMQIAVLAHSMGGVLVFGNYEFLEVERKASSSEGNTYLGFLLDIWADFVPTGNSALPQFAVVALIIAGFAWQLARFVLGKMASATLILIERTFQSMVMNCISCRSRRSKSSLLMKHAMSRVSDGISRTSELGFRISSWVVGASDCADFGMSEMDLERPYDELLADGKVASYNLAEHPDYGVVFRNGHPMTFDSSLFRCTSGKRKRETE